MIWNSHSSNKCTHTTYLLFHKTHTDRQVYIYKKSVLLYNLAFFGKQLSLSQREIRDENPLDLLTSPLGPTGPLAGAGGGH